MRMSIRHHVGPQAPRRLDRLLAVARLADDLGVRLALEDLAQPDADERLVVGDEDGRHRIGSRTRTRSRRSGAPGVEAAAVERHPLAHADEAVAAARHVDPPPAPSSTISSSSESAPSRTRTDACAPPACLSAFVSASWTIRYADSSIPTAAPVAHPRRGARRAGPPRTCVDQRRQVVEPRPRRERVAVGAAQHPHEPPHLGQGAAADPLDRPEHLPRRCSSRVQHPPLGARLHDHHRDVVRDRIVQFARDSRPFLDDGLARRDVPLALRESHAPLAVAEHPSYEHHHDERDDREQPAAVEFATGRRSRPIPHEDEGGAGREAARRRPRGQRVERAEPGDRAAEHLRVAPHAEGRARSPLSAR